LALQGKTIEAYIKQGRLIYGSGGKPRLGYDIFVAPNASIIGSVSVGRGSSIWYGAVLKGDLNNEIEIGEYTEIGNRVVINSPLFKKSKQKTKIGASVVIESGAVIHACTIEDYCHVFPGAVILDGAVLEKNAIVAPGAVVGENERVKSGFYWGGNPGRHVRQATPEETKSTETLRRNLYLMAKMHEEESLKEPRMVETDEEVKAAFRLRKMENVLLDKRDEKAWELVGGRIIDPIPKEKNNNHQ